MSPTGRPRPLVWRGRPMSIARVAGPADTTEVPRTGGPAPGWSAVAIADGSGERHRGALAIDRWPVGPIGSSRGRDGVPYNFRASELGRRGCGDGAGRPPAAPSNQPRGLGVGGDGRCRGAAGGGPAPTVPGFTPRRIAAGADGQTRLLFSRGEGQGELLRLNPTTRSVPATLARAGVIPGYDRYGR